MKISKKQVGTFIAAALLTSALSGKAHAWGPTAHASFAAVLTSHPAIAPLVARRGLDPGLIAYYAVEADKNMPVDWKNGDWTGIKNYDQFVATWIQGRAVNERTVGYLIHILADVSVPSNHSPSGSTEYPTALKNNALENTLEVLGDTLVPAMITPVPPTVPSNLSSVSSIYKWYMDNFLAATKTNREKARALWDRINAHKICLVCPPPPLPTEPKKLVKIFVFPWYPLPCWHCVDVLKDPVDTAAVVTTGWANSLRMAPFVLGKYLASGR